MALTWHDICLPFRAHPNTTQYLLTTAEFGIAVAGLFGQAKPGVAAVLLAVVLAVHLLFGMHVITQVWTQTIQWAEMRRRAERRAEKRAAKMIRRGQV